jgi:hypothetical protein
MPQPSREAAGERTDWLAEFEARRWWVTLADGLVMIGGPLLAALDGFDAAFRALALEHAAEEWAVPALLPRRMVDRIGYADSFAGTLLRAAGVRREDLGGAAPVLLPAACFHLILERDGACIRPADGKVLTCKARVFRNETRTCQLGRLIDFSVREILFFATAERVAACCSGRNGSRQRRVSTTP